jgi:hypothetical protein
MKLPFAISMPEFLYIRGCSHQLLSPRLATNEAIVCFVELEHIDFNVHIEVGDEYESMDDSLRMTIRLPSMVVSYSEVFALGRRPPSDTSTNDVQRKALFRRKKNPG